MELKKLSAAELSQLAVALAGLLAKDATLSDLEVLLHFISLLKDNLQMHFCLEKQNKK